MEVLLVDNYDSFTYNLSDYLQRAEARVQTRRIDEISIAEIDDFDAIVISPGPGLPAEMHNLGELVNYACSRKPVLGICLGLQAIAEGFGGKLTNLQTVFHGVQSQCRHSGDELFTNLPKDFTAGHYHSWVADPASLEKTPLKTIATNEEGWIMALRHEELPIWGVQFHPESVLTPHGEKMIGNWVALCRERLEVVRLGA